MLKKLMSVCTQQEITNDGSVRVIFIKSKVKYNVQKQLLLEMVS